MSAGSYESCSAARFWSTLLPFSMVKKLFRLSIVALVSALSSCTQPNSIDMTLCHTIQTCAEQINTRVTQNWLVPGMDMENFEVLIEIQLGDDAEL
jgi:hypothetical protein